MFVARLCGCTFHLLAMGGLLSCTAVAQISIQQQDVLQIFTPGGFHYYTPGAGGSFDIGAPGGPNV